MNTTCKLRNIIKPVLLTSIVFLLLSQNSFAQDWTNQVDQLFRQWDSDTAGCSIAIVHKGEIIYKNGYGLANLTYDIPNTPSTVFRAASNSKQFTAFSILLLEEEGKLSIEDNIREYIPELADFGNTITISNLLYHTSGIRDYLELMIYGGWNLLVDFVYKHHVLNIAVHQKSLNFNPGDQLIYSNTGYVLLAEIVERVSGKTFVEYTSENIFEPLGMNQSQFVDNPNHIVENFAEGYVVIEGETFNIKMGFSSIGEAGLFTTVEDLSKWDQNFYNPLVGNQEIITKMHQKSLLNNGTETPFSMGLIVDNIEGNEIVFHGGDLGGYHGNIVRFPSHEFSVITLSNQADLNSNVLLQKSIQIFSAFDDSQNTGILDAIVYEPNSNGWGVSVFHEDLKQQNLLMDLYLSHIKKHKESSQITPTAVVNPDEYLGKYYSEELDVFHELELDENRNILLKTFKTQPYLLTVNRVRNDRIYISESSEIGGDFIRNVAGEVTGYQLSGSRAFNVMFQKVEDINFKK